MVKSSTPYLPSISLSCFTTRSMRNCLLLLALAALVRPISCTSDVLDDNPQEAINVEVWRDIDARQTTSTHERNHLYEERELGITDNVFAPTSSTCQEECKDKSDTLRCVKLCTCMRQRRCNEKATAKDRRQCKRMCIKITDESINKSYETISDYSCYRTVKGTFDNDKLGK
jgi:hypothetical protein